ncbi:beta-sandwich domain-containing protein [Bdellovibrio svalbardensis]|uniref:Beta-sandwich domain-containing protein n=1 Tax=Bdellovibrio svalbardensis TaxID=2972972 RepID=A0ABT6DM47_9BACT|nr:beta-sandwich domain-containing protein [Bdellovibrio svalbardensis]MDG0817946.1 beta-sandwich domain-containing protein [Bdellovibrio svalbardensis]
MKKRMIVGALLVTTIAQTASVAHAVNKEDIGGVIGGLIGGLAGTQIGKGNGNTAAIIIGAVAGSMIGSKVGANMDENDRRAVAEAQRRALEGRLNNNCDWDGRSYGSRTGARGRVTSTREGYNQYTGEYCREYRSTIYLSDRTEDTRGIACTRRDGSWYETQETNIRWGGRDNGGGYGGNDVRPAPYNPAPTRPVPPPPAPVQQNREGSVQVSSISRRSGGEWVRVTLARPVSVDQLEVRALSAGVKVHAATVYTETGRQVNVREFDETPTFYAGDKAVSERLNLRERVTTVDINAEGMGGNPDILITVLSNEGRPSLSVSRY